ncbi:NADH:ubiquinone reductase (Na(+)-transporting) subunit C [Vibrio salinus]|uniref:NADH:ubiquinone reductase (Na(+)-transporting) subunit C n=1 Tax=Vibrio salinus TaxID=2899784 RepID=UPI001E5F883A|nr:NADH:ubiquinone reductase (Na(+)-transporting) subunit C [Vibrio salinus]MCE0495702.1 NADH:ubiquinone reductase (Na(+)-transporting) subunit C [Vibrio salinus]
MLQKTLISFMLGMFIVSLSGCDDNKSVDNHAEHEVKTVTLDKRLVMVEVAGLINKRMPMAEVTQKYITPRFVDLNTGRLLKRSMVPENYNEQEAANDPKRSVVLNKQDDIAGIKRRENIGELYLVNDDAGKLDKIIVPVRGEGKYALIYAFVSLNADDLSIYRFGIYKHSETPGLGAKFVDDPDVVKRFTGKHVYKQGVSDFKVIMNHETSVDSNSIDGVSGATMTSDGIQNAINFWCGDNAFGPAIKKLRVKS